MNNPLAIIKGNIDILDYLRTNNELTEEILNKKIISMRKNLNRVQVVIDSMRSFNADDYMSNFKEVDLAQLIQYCINKNIEDYNYDRFKIFNTVRAKKHFIVADEGLMERVFSGLIDNSCLATAKQPEPWLRFEVINENENFISLAVTDSGNGIDSEIVNRIFDPFFTTKPIGEGSGLGLSLAFNIMNMHNGHIEYNNTTMHTQFILRFPKKLKV